nr:MAG: replication associated protein [Arizlama virus]
MEKKQFRCQAKCFFLTYPRCDATKEVLLTHLRSKGCIVQYVIGREEHEEDDEVLGKHHLHAVIRYMTKINVKDPTFFDLNGFHCNIQGCRNFVASAAYAKKDGDFIENADFDYSNPVNYARRKADFNAWKGDQEALKLTEVTWPIKLPDNSDYSPVGKRRHLWIVGAPDGGKSTWAKREFQGKKVFARANTDKPYDGYGGEHVILCDDSYPTQEEWLNVSDDHWMKMHVFGATRFYEKYWPMNIPLVMIVLSNSPPAYRNMEAFNARFIIIEMVSQ